MADNDRRSDEMVGYLGVCVFVFDCTTPGCDGIPERHEERFAELTNEVVSLRCFRDVVAQSGCGQQLKLVAVKPDGASSSPMTQHASIKALIERNASYDDVRNAVRQLLGP